VLFNSWEFALFLPIVLGVYYVLNRRAQNVFLLVASYFFYGWWDYRFCSLLAISTVVDFVVALRLEATQSPGARKALLTVSCVVNLGLLGVFKYFNFFIDSAAALLAAAGLEPHLTTLQIVLPVGISFYTFQTMSYTIDVYRREMPASRDLVDFALYVAYFPQLVAGPIERASRLLPQIAAKRTVTREHLSTGAFLILLGLFRKVAIADGLAPLVNRVFADPEAHGAFQLLVALYAFSLQIYGDFAGYSDIARGTSRLLGIELVENFQHPYFSTSITEFWRRWHVSLSSWLRDYLYIPLGGNRGNGFATYRNLMLTMLLGGLWHGASWNFVVWGGLHGVYLAAHKLMLREKRPHVHNRLPAAHLVPMDTLKAIFTFHLVALTWIFFRASDFSVSWAYLTGIVTGAGPWEVEGLGRLLVAGALVYAVDATQYLRNDHAPVARWHWIPAGLVCAAMVLAIFALRTDETVPFIYFQF